MAEKDMTQSEKKTEFKKETAAPSLKIPLTRVWQSVSGVLALLLIISIWQGWGSPTGAVPVNAMNQDQVAAKTVKYINDNLLQQGMTATLSGVSEKNGVYEINITANGKTIPVLASKDGNWVFPTGFDMNKPIVQATAAAEPAKPVEKTDKPKVQLFVMSHCPYGVQAEDAIKPALDLMAGKIDFELRFIANENSDGTFTSLHGQTEVDEDLRQVAIEQLEPAKLMNYVFCRNQNIQSDDWQSCAKTAGIDADKVKALAESADGKKLLSDNIKLAEQLGVGGSPTIKINGGDYNGGRTPEAFKQGICDAFNTAPSSCSNTLNSTAAAASGGCAQ